MAVLHRFLERVPDVVCQLDKLWVSADFIGDARPRQRNVKNLSDAARPRCHDHHTIREIDRFIHTMGDEDHGFPLALPKLQKFLLEELAGFGIDRTERRIHEEDYCGHRHTPWPTPGAAACRRKAREDSDAQIPPAPRALDNRARCLSVLPSEPVATLN